MSIDDGWDSLPRLRDRLTSVSRERDEARAFVRQLYACWLIPHGTDMNELWAEIEEECSWLVEGGGER
jgi:hypothetical protein